jgi:hypothetical protein
VFTLSMCCVIYDRAVQHNVGWWIVSGEDSDFIAESTSSDHISVLILLPSFPVSLCLSLSLSLSSNPSSGAPKIFSSLALFVPQIP